MSATTGNSKVMLMFGDGRHGYELARALCCYNEEKKKIFEMMCVVVDKKFVHEMKDVQSKHCKIIGVDFSKPHEHESMREMEEAITSHELDWMVLLPTGDSLKKENIKRALECFKEKSHGKNVILASKAKLEEMERHPVDELKELEKMVKQIFERKHVILRCQMIMEDLDFFAKDLKEHKAWRLPIENGAFSPIDLCDAGCAAAMIFSSKTMPDKFVGQTFTITNRDKINGQRLAELTRTAFNEDVKFESIGLQEADQILKRHQKKEEQRTMDTKKKLHLLSNKERELLLWEFEMIKNGKFNFTTDDWNKICPEKQPCSVDEYLRRHEDHFRGSR